MLTYCVLVQYLNDYYWKVGYFSGNMVHCFAFCHINQEQIAVSKIKGCIFFRYGHIVIYYQKSYLFDDGLYSFISTEILKYILYSMIHSLKTVCPFIFVTFNICCFYIFVFSEKVYLLYFIASFISIFVSGRYLSS